MIPTPQNLVVRTMQIPAYSSWTVPAARAALDELEWGDFAAAALLLDAFGRDDRISTCLGKRTGALAAKRGLPFQVVPSDRDGRRKTTHAKRVEALWWDSHGEATLKRVQRDAVGLGAAVGRIAWLPDDGGQWKPKLIPLHAANLFYNVTTGEWFYRSLDGNLKVTPGDGNWFLYTPSGDLQPWMSASVRALAMLFVFRGFTWRDWARWTERHGMPIITADVPINAKAEHVNAFMAALRNLGNEAAIPLRQSGKDVPGFGVGLVEAKDTAHAGFQTLLERIDICVAVHLLGQNLTTEVSSGAFASTAAHVNVEGNILSGDAEGLATVLREQVWKPWALYNYGDPELAPWGEWNTDPAEDRKATADTQKTAAEGLKIWIDLGVPVDVEEYAERFGIELRDGARMPEPEAPDPNAPPPVPPAPQPGADGTTTPNQPPANGKAPLMNSLSNRPHRSGMHNGQAFIEEVAMQAAQRAVRAVAPDVAAVLAAIEGATTYDEVKARLLLAFEGMDPTKLAKLTEKALVLSRIAGRVAVNEDL